MGVRSTDCEGRKRGTTTVNSNIIAIVGIYGGVRSLHEYLCVFVCIMVTFETMRDSQQKIYIYIYIFKECNNNLLDLINYELIISICKNVLKTSQERWGVLSKSQYILWFILAFSGIKEINALK